MKGTWRIVKMPDDTADYPDIERPSLVLVFLADEDAS
jgi:hypothetical protein